MRSFYLNAADKARAAFKPAPSLVFLLTVLFCAGFAGAESVKELNKKIRSHKKNLEQIDDQIKSLENEGERLKQDEDSLSRTIKTIENDIERSNKKQAAQRRTILETESKVKQTKQQIALLSDEGKMWENAVFSDMKNYHQAVIFPQRLARNPMQAWVLRAAVALRAEQMKDTHSKIAFTQDKERDLLRSKEKLVRVRSELEAEIVREKKTKEEKARLHKTTQGKRLIAQAEVQRLNDTREALEKLIGSLAEKKKETLTAQREAELAKKSFHERRGNLPWPSAGAVTATFGRQKHPDLNIMVIHNGIKIKAPLGEAVKAVEKGTVIYASDFRSYGQTVIIDHGGNTFSVYGLLGSIRVKEGEKVPSGREIGTAPEEEPSQIYFELKNQGRSENPLLWLAQR